MNSSFSHLEEARVHIDARRAMLDNLVPRADTGQLHCRLDSMVSFELGQVEPLVYGGLEPLVIGSDVHRLGVREVGAHTAGKNRDGVSTNIPGQSSEGGLTYFDGREGTSGGYKLIDQPG